jgi:hypothetical protein
MAGASLRQFAVATIFLGILGLATHGRVVDNGYVYDAVLLVQVNPHVRADASVVEIFSSPYWNAEIAPGRGLYRPFSLLGFQLTRRIWDEPVSVDHAIDLALHVLCSLVLLVFLMQMGAHFGVALALATLFLLHPVQTEVVASLVGRSDLLATLFALLALVLSLARRVSVPLLWIGLFGLFSLSLLAKESTVTLVVLLPACWAARESWRGAVHEKVTRHAIGLSLCLGLAVACNLALRQVVLGDLLISDTTRFDDGATGFFELRWRALAFATLYAQKLIWPIPLLPDYLTGVVPTKGLELHLRAVLSGVAILVSVVWAAWDWRRRRSLTRVPLGILLFWIAMAPVSNFLLQIGTPFGERLLYFPLIFLMLAAVDLPLWRPVDAASLGSVPRGWPAWVVVCLLLGVMSAMRIPDWKDNRSLFQAAVADCPDSYFAQFTYASILYREGRPGDQELARMGMEAAARLNPDAYTPRVALGVMAKAEGNALEARSRFEEAYARVTQVTDREHQTAALNLSRAYLELGEFQKLESFIVPLAREHSEWKELQAELGDYWLSRGQVAEALAVYERALEESPQELVFWRQVIWAHLRLGQDPLAAKSIHASPPGTMSYLFKLQLKRDGLTLPNLSE